MVPGKRTNARARLVLAAAATSLSAPAVVSGKPSNFVIMLADDMGGWALSMYGCVWLCALYVCVCMA